MVLINSHNDATIFKTKSYFNYTIITFLLIIFLSSLHFLPLFEKTKEIKSINSSAGEFC